MKNKRSLDEYQITEWPTHKQFSQVPIYAPDQLLASKIMIQNICPVGHHLYKFYGCGSAHLGPLLLTRINFNPSMDK